MNALGFTCEHHKLAPPFRSPVGRSDVPGRAGRTPPTLQCIDDSRLRKARSSDDPSFSAMWCLVDEGAKIAHTPNSKDILYRVKRTSARFGEGNVYPSLMVQDAIEPWPQRQHFRQLVDSWVQETGRSKADFAKACDIKTTSLKQYYSGKQVPGRGLALKFAEVLKCGMGELFGEPGGDQDADPGAIAFRDTMYFLGKEMSPEERKIIVEMVKQGKALAKARREREAKEKKP